MSNAAERGGEGRGREREVEGEGRGREREGTGGLLSFLLSYLWMSDEKERFVMKYKQG